jgi:hypothetical protein
MTEYFHHIYLAHDPLVGRLPLQEPSITVGLNSKMFSISIYFKNILKPSAQTHSGTVHRS